MTPTETIRQRIADRQRELGQQPTMAHDSQHRLRRLIAKDRLALAALEVQA